MCETRSRNLLILLVILYTFKLDVIKFKGLLTIDYCIEIFIKNRHFTLLLNQFFMKLLAVRTLEVVALKISVNVHLAIFSDLQPGILPTEMKLS